MCLILLAWRAHPDYPLLVAANRDEYFARPSAAADFWEDPPGLLAGRDLEAGGTWLGVTPAGRFAALTNYRNPAERRPQAPSRGDLVRGFLAGHESPRRYLQAVERRAAEYNGFSLLVGDITSLYFYSNRGSTAAPVSPGVHGLSNHLLDTPWPKITKGKRWLAEQLDRPFDHEAAFSALDDTTVAPDGELPNTGVSVELEERLSAMRIPASGGYGTRCTTVVSIAESGPIEFHERAFAENGSIGTTVSYRLTPARGRGTVTSRRGQSRLPGTRLPAR